MKTGIELIDKERQEQVEKHGWDLNHDQDYGANELSRAARFCLSPQDKSLWPWRDGDIGTYFMEKIISKNYEQRLIICGAFCAAELDRINKVEYPITKKVPVPTDEEVNEWFNLNIGNYPCSASSAIYKFRVWLNERES